MTRFWERLTERKLVQWMVAYAAGAFALIQLFDVIGERFGWPDIVEQLIILSLAIGFFVALVLAWYHGERGQQDVVGTELLIIALLLGIGAFVLWTFVREPAPRAANAVQTPASTLAHAAARPSLLAAVSAHIPAKSVAVLPFANQGGDPEEQFFSDGLSEGLINVLSQFSGLKVISRTSAFQFRDSKESSAAIGAKLGVAHLLEGAVQHVGDAVRITATLVNAADGRTLWSRQYDRPYRDLFALQDDITHSVSSALQAELLTAPGMVVQSDRPPSGNLAAYSAYQHGITYFTQNSEAGMRKSIEAFAKAIKLDPRYVAAYARLSFAWNGLAGQYLGGSDASAANAKARDAADTALKLDQNSSLAHLARSNLLMFVDMDWAGAESEARHALQLTPNDASAQFALGRALAALGQVRKAVDLARKALAHDPRHASWYNWLATYLTALGRLDEAGQALDTAMALRPGAVASHEQATIVAVLRGDPSAALAAAQGEAAGVWRDVAVTMALQTGTDRVAADKALADLIAQHAGKAPYQIAEVYALRKDPDHMFQWLDRAWASGDPGIAYLLFDPMILRYRHDPRFAVYCKKVGLPTATDAVAMQ